MLKTTSLILSLLLIAGCNGLPKFPVKEVRIIDVRAGVCSRFEVLHQTGGKPKYRRIGELPLSDCDGLVGMTPTDYKKSEAWMINVQNEFTCKVKQ